MAQGRKTGGRKPGSKNKRTLEREAALAQVSEALKATIGDHAFDGDAHALLMAVYKNGTLPMEMRLDAAKSAVRYEKPALASTDTTFKDTTQYHVALPDGSVSMDEWRAKYSVGDELPDEDKVH